MDYNRLSIGVARMAGIGTAVRWLCSLNQEVGGGDLTLFCDHRHATPWTIVIDLLQGPDRRYVITTSAEIAPRLVQSNSDSRFEHDETAKWTDSTEKSCVTHGNQKSRDQHPQGKNTQFILFSSTFNALS